MEAAIIVGLMLFGVFGRAVATGYFKRCGTGNPAAEACLAV